MTSTNLVTPRRALAVGAHPDDIEFGCGATLAKWAASGCDTYLLVCTDGSKGSWSKLTDQKELVETRQREQQVAAHELASASEVIFLGCKDGELQNGDAQRRQVASWIRRLRPDAVLGHDPWRRYRLHPDHRHAGFLVTDAIVGTRDPLFYPDLDDAPHRPTTLLLFEADEVDHVEDVTATFDHKLAALLAHKSQLESTMHIATNEQGEMDKDDLERFRATLREELASFGATVGFGLGEGFKRIDDT